MGQKFMVPDGVQDNSLWSGRGLGEQAMVKGPWSGGVLVNSSWSGGEEDESADYGPIQGELTPSPL